MATLFAARQRQPILHTHPPHPAQPPGDAGIFLRELPRLLIELLELELVEFEEPHRHFMQRRQRRSFFQAHPPDLHVRIVTRGFLALQLA